MKNYIIGAALLLALAIVVQLHRINNSLQAAKQFGVTSSVASSDTLNTGRNATNDLIKLFTSFNTTTANTFIAAQNFTATSTGTKGFDITGGCFAINGTCLSSGADGTFSTTSAEYFLSLNQGAAFSTTSVNYWEGTQWRWATSSASYFLSVNQGAAFSTTSANVYVHSSTTIPKTYTANTWIALQTFAAASTTDISASNSVFVNFAGGLLYSGASKQVLTQATSTKTYPPNWSTSG